MITQPRSKTLTRREALTIVVASTTTVAVMASSANLFARTRNLDDPRQSSSPVLKHDRPPFVLSF